MSTLFIGVAIMAKIDSDKWQGRGFVIVAIITQNYYNFEMHIFLKKQSATFSPHKDFDSTIVHFFLNVLVS
jgi:hypothetical protein